MKDTPQPTRQEILKKDQSTCRSGPASFDDKVEWRGEGTCANARTAFPRTSER